MISEVALVSVAGEEFYEFSNISQAERVTVELSRATMATRSVQTLGIRDGLQFEAVTTIEPHPGEQSSRIEAIALDDLMLKLRGFPFSSDDQISVLFAASTRGSQDRLAPHVTHVKDERLRIGSETVDSHKLELVFSAPRLWKAFGLVPRTFLWYGAVSPHILLRAETTEVPGSPRWLLEIVEVPAR